MASAGDSTKKKKKFVFLFKGSPLNDFLYPFKKAANQWVTRYMIVICGLIIRSAVGLGSYSGENNPPMFGDFEAQRHWLEITTGLPMKDWYFYDLQYWGLDYPPLTAYHSWLLGMFGKLNDSSWFKLDVSRGFENTDLKSYMRLTVILSELIFYIPAVLQYTHCMGYYNNASSIDQNIIAAAIIFLPDLTIIDHGHFQYNSVMLGLSLMAVNNLLYNNIGLASIFFVMAICFKQMALYYAPIFFFYLLSLCIFPTINIPRLFYISFCVIMTLLFIFGPFIYVGGISQINQILFRMFPFSRGIFEDKVANFWCATNVVIKYKDIFSTSQLQKLSLFFTLVGITPSCYFIFFNHNKKRILSWCLASCSLAFFLFSFQVHEKSILLPWMPVTLLLNEVDPEVISMICWFFNMSLFSMTPLLKRDGLVLQYLVLGILSNWLMGNLSWIRKYTNLIFPFVSKRKNATPILPHSWFWRLLIVSSYIAAGILIFCDLSKEPPQNLPDLWVIGNCLLSFSVFSIFYLWLNYKIYIICSEKSKFD